MKKEKLFTFDDNKLLCWRLGPINAIKQRHYNKDTEWGRLTGTHKPPVSRGFWAFPYPYYDYFFCYHQWENHLPKKLLNDDLSEKEWIEREEKLKEIQRLFKPSTFYARNFYSHIFPNGRTDYDDWFFWESPREWGKIAQKTLITIEKWGNQIFKTNYSKDHLEIFVS